MRFMKSSVNGILGWSVWIFILFVFLLCFNFLVTLCHNLSIKCCHTWLLSNWGRSPENSLSSPPPHSSITHHYTLLIKYSMFPEQGLQVCTSAPLFMLLPLPGMSSFYHPSSIHYIKTKVSLLSVKALLFPLVEKARMASITLCIGYAFIPLGYICVSPTQSSSLSQKLGLLYLYAPLPSSGITPGRGAFSLPITEWCTVRLLILRWRNEIMFLISNVVSWKFIAATGISRKQNTHSLKAVRAVFW